MKKRNPRGLNACLPALIALLATCTCPPARATIWHVDKTGDNAASTTTLRYAMTHAAANDTILFDVGGQIFLGSALPTVSANLTIQCATNLTISGQNLYQIFVVNGSTVAISGLKLKNGWSSGSGGVLGGAINNSGTLSLSNVWVSDCHSGGNGGAIYNQSVLTLILCTFTNNSGAGTDGQ